MRFKKLKMGLASGMIAVMMLASAGSALAATDSKAYEVNYQKGAPTTSANLVCNRKLIYSAAGFNAVSSTLSGSSDRKVTITGSGMATQTIKDGNRIPNWTTPKPSGSYCTFRLVASGSVSCRSNGTINAK